MIALEPSKTLAIFLSKNTCLPFEMWWIILKQKHNQENNDLLWDTTQKLTIVRHTLRNGKKYMIPVKVSNLSFYDKLNIDCYQLFNCFFGLTKYDKSTSFFHKLVYKALVKFANFLGNWYYYIKLNKNIPCFKSMLDNIKKKTSEFTKEAYNLPGSSKYRNLSINVADDIYDFGTYMYCLCENNSCFSCKDFQYYYLNYYEYNTNYMELRSGKRIYKPNCFSDPIIIHNVYNVNT